jgi:Xaa-Pro aminopeptidase
MSAWSDIRLVRDVGMSYVPEEVEFTNITFTSLGDVVGEFGGSAGPSGVKICGFDAMSVALFERLKRMLGKATIENGDSALHDLRLVKSPAEVRMLAEAWRICDAGYRAVLDADLVGLTENQAAALGEKAARDAGAEHIVFSVFGSGERRNTVVGRPTRRVIREGDMNMYALAVQYEGYIASDEWPFVAGHKPTRAQEEFIDTSCGRKPWGFRVSAQASPKARWFEEFRTTSGNMGWRATTFIRRSTATGSRKRNRPIQTSAERARSSREPASIST